ncbi:MAG: tetratricopeptide repeat protein [Bacteroidota bacterium]
MAKSKHKKKKVIHRTLPNWWTNSRLHAIIVFAFCVSLYANTIGHNYTQDDAIVIYDNMFTTEGVSGIKGLLTKDTFFGFFKVEGKDNLVQGGRYRPLTLIQFAIGWEIFGNQPWVFHLMNIFWYAICCVMVYWLLLRLLNRYDSNIYIHFIALGTALLFAAHPIHVEAVANIKGRDEIMTMLGSLAALYFALRAYDEEKTVWQIVAAGLFFLGLMAKENAITFLAVIPLSFFVFRRLAIGQSLLRTWPFLATTLLYLGIRFAVLGFAMGEASGELMNNPFLKLEGGAWVSFSFAEWSATILFTLGKYVQLLIFPHPLTHDYYPRQVDIMSWSDWQVLLSFGLYAAATVYALIRLPKRDPISYGVLFFIITLSIVSNIVFPIGTNMGERFLFVPSLGFCFIVMILLWRLGKRLAQTKTIANIQQIRVPLAIVGLVVLLFTAKSFMRNFIWKDNFTLFTTDVYTSPNSAKVQNSAAGALLEASTGVTDEQARLAIVERARGHAEQAIQIHPTYKNAYLLLGNAHNYLKNYDASIRAYEQALQLDENYQEAINNLAITYREAGRYHGEKLRDAATSIQYLEKALEMRPNEVEVLRLLGIAYGVSGQTAKAIEMLERAIQITPDNASILYNLGAAHGQLGNTEQAQAYINRAKAIDPSIGG